MSILVNKDSKVLVQGFTGSEGSFHSEQMIEYGTDVVCGVTPGKGGTKHLDRPVYNSVADAVINEDINTSIIFVPPMFAADAIMEAAESGIKTIVTITEGIPINDMTKVVSFIEGKNIRLIGPNCPGIITPNEAKIGIMPGFVFKKGNIGIISKSGTLTYEAAIKTSLIKDYYLTMSNIDRSDYYNIKFQKKPLMAWIWISVIMIVVGGSIRLFNNAKNN